MLCENGLKDDIDNIQKKINYMNFTSHISILEFQIPIAIEHCVRLTRVRSFFESDLLAFFTHWNVIVTLLWIDTLFNISLKLQHLIPQFFPISLSLTQSKNTQNINKCTPHIFFSLAIWQFNHSIFQNITKLNNHHHHLYIVYWRSINWKKWVIFYELIKSKREKKKRMQTLSSAFWFMSFQSQ